MDEKTSLEQRLIEQRGMLERWFIQNQIAVLKALEQKYGPGVTEIVDEALGLRICGEYRKLAERFGVSSIEDLIKGIWEPSLQRGLEYTLEEKDGGVLVKCTKCHIHDFACEIGETRWMYHLFCATDYKMTEGFNPKIGIKRTKTLMEGHDCCDTFYYYIKD